MRTIKLYIEEKQLSREQMYAIGRLATWSLDNYDIVTISDDGTTCDLLAHYTSSEHSGKYVIGAIYHLDSNNYSFHS